MKIGDAIGAAGLRMAALNSLRTKGVVSDEALAASLAPAIDQIRANDAYWHEKEGERRLNAAEWMNEVLAHAVAEFRVLTGDDQYPQFLLGQAVSKRWVGLVTYTHNRYVYENDS